MKPVLTHMTAVSVSAFLIVADLLTKLWIESAFKLGDSVSVIPGFFSVVYIKNKGASFGLLSQVEGNVVIYGFAVMAMIAIGFIIALYRTLPPEDIISRVAFVLIGSGAFGNLIDRFRSGAVTDFLLFYVGQWAWPAFNVADSCITVGVVVLAYTILFRPTAVAK
ncbi:MAG: signal peptidase II [Nitrospinae bacterium]|nr:signal peptidase II [Nitrospinota bacterium]